MGLHSSFQHLVVWSIVAALVLIASIAGCSGSYGHKNTTGDPKTVTADPPSLSASAQQGKKLFDSLGCLGCHTVNGQGGSVGPNLSNEGNSGHSDQWLATQIRHPRDNDPQTIMPAFDNLSTNQVNNLVDYLKNLKTSDGQATSERATAGRAKRAQATPSASGVSLTAGGEMWSKTCGECHNLRPPSEYSDAQWAVAVHHMRVRAPLTGRQQKEILEFLQASN